MNLPNDVARCHGMTTHAICSQRESCRRALEAKLDQVYPWMAAEIPGPCSSYLPKREAPAASAVPNLNPKSPSPGALP